MLITSLACQFVYYLHNYQSYLSEKGHPLNGSWIFENKACLIVKVNLVTWQEVPICTSYLLGVNIVRKNFQKLCKAHILIGMGTWLSDIVFVLNSL